MQLSTSSQESGISERPLDNNLSSDRRNFVHQLIAGSCCIAGGLVSTPDVAEAAVGTLPEFKETNAIIQGITVNVADKSQQDGMIDFLVEGFDFKVLRKRIVDTVEDTVSQVSVASVDCVREKTNSDFMLFIFLKVAWLWS